MVISLSPSPSLSLSLSLSLPLSLSLSLPLSRMDGPFVSLTIFEPISQITFPVTSMKHLPMRAMPPPVS